MICIIGAGIVGCASAYQLKLAGFDVMLIDASAGPGEGCSSANGAQLSYSYVEPLASPATLKALPGLLMRRDSPLRFAPTGDWRQYAWCLQFLMACRGARVEQGTRSLLSLSDVSRSVLAEWMRNGRWDVSFARTGKLVLCPDERAARRQRSQVAFQARLGCDQEYLDLAGCVEKEPALCEAFERSPKAFLGGVWTAGECVVDPRSLCHALVDRFVALGGTSRFNTRVDGFTKEGGAVRALLTAAGDIPCAAVVVAAGSAAAGLAKRLGDYLPVYPIKGYSLTIPLDDARPRPRVSVTDLGRKTVFAPLGSTLRVAAFAELSKDTRVDSVRIESMKRSVDAMYPGRLKAGMSLMPWAGLRPATPDSLPIIGRSPRCPNVFYNAGHGALGLTLAAGSALMLQRCLLDGEPSALGAGARASIVSAPHALPLGTQQASAATSSGELAAPY